ncbi:MAG TPA: tubulin-like doman-containing protein [Gemmataceae bacterium]|nr:tubulin-like doman-containing protein [Gemmataceae bacterium]
MEQIIRPNSEPIPGYRLLQRLGRGGYGEVWKVEAPGGMHKAIKFVFGNLDAAGDDGKAAEQEYKSLNRVKTIRHPFLLSLERMEVIDGQLVIVMELADKNLADRFTECVNSGMPGIPRQELLGYMDEAAEALDLMNLHHQIQHLDIKPQNLFLVHQHIKVADFGLAKDMEGAKAILTGGMTPTYAPPETFEGWISRQSDQYSLAIVFMEMLTGRRPFNGASTRQLILQHLSAIPELSPLHSPDREAVARALAKNPEDRFPTCKDFVRALREQPAGAAPAYPHADTPTRPPTPTGDTSVPRKAATDKVTPEPRAAETRKSLPALVTRGSKVVPTGLRPAARPASAPAAEGGSQKASGERTGDGVLFPALVIGVGGTGLAVLNALRRLLLDRFRRPTLPHLRWLFIDTDEAAATAAVAQNNPTALSQDEVLLTRLKRPTHYLTRDGLPPVEQWLPAGELYRMPRTNSTDGVRAFGRLALCDHYQVAVQRIRASLEPFVRPDAVEETQRLTSLPLRSTYPRVYLATSLSGGTGSGMFVDLAYLVRRELVRLGFGAPLVVGLFGVPPYTADGREARGLANARAALTELNHYSRAGTPYKAQFDTREPAVLDDEPPFRRCSLVRLANRADRGEQSADVAAHLAYVDMLTPIGRVAHPDSGPAPATPLTLVGIRRLSWPRAQVLRTAGWMLARQMVQSWLVKGELPPGAVAAAIEAQWNDREFGPAALGNALEVHLENRLGGPPEKRISAAIAAAARDSNGDGTVAVKDGFLRLMDFLGKPAPGESDQPGEMTRILNEKVRELATKVDQKLTLIVLSLMEQPGLRVAAAEDAIEQLKTRLREVLAGAEHHAAIAQEHAVRDFLPVQPFLTASSGGQTGRAANAAAQREGGPLLRQWALSQVNAQLARACAKVIRIVVDNLPEYMQELKAVQSQLINYARQLEEAQITGPKKPTVTRAVFPDEAESVTEAATRLINALADKDRREFENGLQARIRHECRGVAYACSRPREIGPTFINLLADQSVKFLERRVAEMPAAAALEIQCSDEDAYEEQVRELVTSAAPAPLGPEPAPSPTQTVLALPDDESSERFCENVGHFFPGFTFKKVSAPDDVIILQEAQGIAAGSLPHLVYGVPVPVTGEAQPLTNAHARADVPWEAVGAR